MRIGAISDSSVRISRLFSFRLPLVASPEYFKRHGKPQHPRDLTHFPALVYTHIASASTWYFNHPDEGMVSVDVAGRFHVNNGMAAVPALVAGLGITLQPEFYVWRELQDGRLEEALTDWSVPPAPVHLLTPPQTIRPARVKLLIDFLKQHFASQPWARGIEV